MDATARRHRESDGRREEREAELARHDAPTIAQKENKATCI